MADDEHVPKVAVLTEDASLAVGLTMAFMQADISTYKSLPELVDAGRGVDALVVAVQSTAQGLAVVEQLDVSSVPVVVIGDDAGDDALPSHVTVFRRPVDRGRLVVHLKRVTGIAPPSARPADEGEPRRRAGVLSTLRRLARADEEPTGVAAPDAPDGGSRRPRDAEPRRDPGPPDHRTPEERFVAALSAQLPLETSTVWRADQEGHYEIVAAEGLGALERRGWLPGDHAALGFVTSPQTVQLDPSDPPVAALPGTGRDGRCLAAVVPSTDVTTFVLVSGARLGKRHTRRLEQLVDDWFASAGG